MTKNTLLKLIEKGVIDINNKTELESFLVLNDETASIFLNIKNTQPLKDYVLLHFSNDGVLSLLVRDKYEKYLLELKHIKDEKAFNSVLNLIDDINLDISFKLTLDKHIKQLDSVEKVEAIRNYGKIHSKIKISDKSLILNSILNTDDPNILNSYSRILTDEKFQSINDYSSLISKIIEIKNLEKLLLIEKFIKESPQNNYFLEILNKIISCNNLLFLDAFINILTLPNLNTFNNYKIIVDKLFSIQNNDITETFYEVLCEKIYNEENTLKILNILEKLNLKLLHTFKRLAITMVNEDEAMIVLENLLNLKNPNFGNDYYDIVTNIQHDNFSEIISLTSKLRTNHAIYAFSSLVNDYGLSQHNYLLFVLRLVLLNQDRFYSDTLLSLITNDYFLNSKIYLNNVDKLFHINDERKIIILSEFFNHYNDILDEKFFDIFISNAFKINNNAVLENYLTLYKNTNIVTNEYFTIILNNVKNIKSISIFNKVMNLLTDITVDNRFKDNTLRFIPFLKREGKVSDLEFIIRTITNIDNETKLDYFINAVMNTEFRDTQCFQLILNKIYESKTESLPYFYKIIDTCCSYINSDHFKEFVIKYSNIEDKMILKELCEMLDNNLGASYFINASEINDIRLLKDLNLMFNDLITFNYENINDKINEFINNFIKNYYTDEFNYFKNFIRSRNNIIRRHYKELYKVLINNYELITYQNSYNNIIQIITLIPSITPNELDNILNILCDMSINYEKVSLETISKTGTYNDFINSINELDENEEIKLNTLVKKIK